MTDVLRVLTADRSRAGWAMSFVLITSVVRTAMSFSVLGVLVIPPSARIFSVAFGLAAFGVAIVVFEVWLYLAYKHLALIAARRWEPFWAIVGWLIPIPLAGLIIPTQIMSDVWRGYHLDPPAVAKRNSSLLIGWLVFLLLGALPLVAWMVLPLILLWKSRGMDPSVLEQYLLRHHQYAIEALVTCYFASAISGFLLAGYLARTRQLLRLRLDAISSRKSGIG
jgi:hypothetical protein